MRVYRAENPSCKLSTRPVPQVGDAAVLDRLRVTQPRQAKRPAGVVSFCAAPWTPHWRAHPAVSRTPLRCAGSTPAPETRSDVRMASGWMRSGIASAVGSTRPFGVRVPGHPLTSSTEDTASVRLDEEPDSKSGGVPLSALQGSSPWLAARMSVEEPVRLDEGANEVRSASQVGRWSPRCMLLNQ